MIYEIILAASLLLLLAFSIERICEQSNVPSVMVLVALGFIAKLSLSYLGIQITWLESAIPILGTFGLILIVLEGTLDITLKKEKLPLLFKALSAAGMGFLLGMVLFVFVGHFFLNFPIRQALLLAVPFSVISSAVAIPSSRFLSEQDREFVIYESSLSDIIGVLVFFVLLGSDGTFSGFWINLLGGGIVSIVLALICSFALILVLMRIESHIRFVPVLAVLFALYALGKLFHLSPLILVLFFGLLLNKPNVITRFRPFNSWIDDSYQDTLDKFKTIVIELTFVIRSFFFILIGYNTKIEDMVSMKVWGTAFFVFVGIYFSHYIALRVIRLSSISILTWVAPRGLITVLLFIYAAAEVAIPEYLNSAVMLIVVSSSIPVLFTQRLLKKYNEKTMQNKEEVQSTTS